MKKFLLLLLPIILLGVACSKKPATTTNTDTTNTAVVDNGIGGGTGGGGGQGNRRGATGTAEVTWQNNGNGWVAIGTPPACPTPLLQTPVDVTKVTSILYPGQIRGGNYKPHGGFRFDTSTDNLATVTAPMDAQIVRGARYLVDGETQYTFDFIAPCGIMYRLGHLLTLSSKYQAIADTFPAAVEGDSRTTNLNPYVSVTAGETIATAIGVTARHNTFVDFGVYDLRTKNAASQNAAYAASHDVELAQHALCWFDLLPAADAATVRSLPASDSASGKTSDYCT